jgi:hypothetical protein
MKKNRRQDPVALIALIAGQSVAGAQGTPAIFQVAYQLPLLRSCAGTILPAAIRLNRK